MSIGPDHFRYRTSLDEDGVMIICDKFVVIGETKYFYYVVPWNLSGLAKVAGTEKLKDIRRRVSKHSSKRYCYPVKKDALHSFSKRQAWRLSHAKMATSQATLALAEVERMIEANFAPECLAPHPCGHDEYTSRIRWE